MANPYGPYSTSNTLGIDFDLRKKTFSFAAGSEATPDFALGQSALGTDNTTWVYVVADVAVAADAQVQLNADFHITATGSGNYTGGAAFEVGDFGWVQKTTNPPL